MDSPGGSPTTTGRVNLQLFLMAFISAVYTYYYSDVDPSLRVVNVPNQDLRPEYDFIIVGAGSAGNVLANRLTENTNWTVLLLEAGGDEDAISDTPFLAVVATHSYLDWNYTTVPQQRACGAMNEGRCNWPRGRVIGGSSGTNVMYYVRGNPYDYNNWAAQGNEGWDYDSIFPYFLRSEDINIPTLEDSPYHSRDGPLSVQYPRYTTPLRDVYVSAGVDIGYMETDYNSPNQTGFARGQYTIRGPSRCSTGKAFLRTARNRTNLNVAYHAFVTKVLFNDTTAVGVQFERDGDNVTVMARREVIVSAGAINTPQLLMLSGVGHADHLASMGIPLVADLAVGDNLQDHLSVGMFYEVNKNVTITNSFASSNESINAYTREGEGPLTNPAGWESIAFISSDGNTRAAIPDVQFHIGSYVRNEYDANLFELWVLTLRPLSRGTLRLASTDPHDKPIIDPRYFSDDANYDYTTTYNGLRVGFEWASTPSLAPYQPRLYPPQYERCRDALESGNQDAIITCLIQNYSFTNFHPAGTSKMGPSSDPAAVVAPDLRVHGLTGIRVIDASIMPTITSGNLNAPTIMIAERASDLIKEYYR